MFIFTKFLFLCAQFSLTGSHYVKFVTHISRFVPSALNIFIENIHLDMFVICTCRSWKFCWFCQLNWG